MFTAYHVYIRNKHLSLIGVIKKLRRHDVDVINDIIKSIFNLVSHLTIISKIYHAICQLP